MKPLSTTARTIPGAPSYPHDREAEIVLRDGSTVHVRPVRSNDKRAIRAFLEGLSEDSIGFRFFGMPDLDWVVEWAVDVDYADRFALVAESGTPRRIVAHSAYMRIDGARAEVAFLVADQWQGQGISTVMLAQLAEVAARHGMSTFTAEVLPDNHRMIEVFRQSGFRVDMRSTPTAIEVELPTSLSADALARFEDRERCAAVAAVRGILQPHSIAVIGASRRPESVGGAILKNLLTAQFNGPIYAVNSHADVVQGLPGYHSVLDVPEPVELAVVVVPAEQVVAVARQCAARGVRTLLVVSAGFAELGGEGADRQRELLALCRGAGMRLIGPNCFGALNTAANVSLNATFAPHPATPGRVGFMSQSGGLGIAVIEAAARHGIGLSSFVSVGNKADLSGNDFVRYWEQDEGTDVALLYLESFGNPRKFGRVAPRFARQKPLIAVKSGRSVAGARATSSHTGALLAASDVTVDALFKQAGVIRTDTLQEMFDVASLLTAQPVPQGDRIAIVTNAGGPGILCADACQAHGVAVPELSAPVRTQLAAFLPTAASIGNPIDMIASASADDYRRTFRVLINEDACDAILAIFAPPLVTRAADVAVALHEVAATRPGVPIAAVFMTAEGAPDELSTQSVRVPSYEFPEEAAQAVALAAAYGRWRSRAPGSVVAPSGTRSERAAAIISRELGAGSDWLSPKSVAALLHCYGLPLLRTQLVQGASQAAAAAAQIGAPVALKATARDLLHKSDAGGVRLDLKGTTAVKAAAQEMEQTLAAAGYRLDGLIVQPMAPPGVELIVGVVNDHNFGPVLACGAGGTTAELIRDVAVRITPLTDLDAREMVRSLKTFPLLDGYRGAARCNVGAVEDVLERVSAMVEAHPEIVELDCNPLIATPDGAVVVDARVRVEAPPARPPVSSLGS
jgi:acetyl coenzyme A synthetase (ADP forming)-like protein